MCSRAQYASVKDREDFGKPGVYLLAGPSDTDGLPQIYIGEADVARHRLDYHVREKDFWTHLILFTSKDENLNKAHVKYIEARLIGRALEAKRARMENARTQQLLSLSEADTADAEAFLDDMLLLYPLLGISAFEVAPPRPREAVRLLLDAKGTKAEGSDTSEGFVVYAGSVARVDPVPSLHQYIDELRKQLEEQGVLMRGPGGLVLSQDYVFSSPSNAAAVMLGRTANGRIEWKDTQGRTLKALQEQELESTGTVERA